ncbi:hypothetical protein JTE90_001174 [Oedothorax gibbosus]|uniref:Uncharacterized protein n=1 Tax=Oedothorax gibbosus TaxID=931172 RepID=A0AAV6VII4_9ARAC|nr:hypothetical protein JTE90_001174 [Oedothorax gibbosus]
MRTKGVLFACSPAEGVHKKVRKFRDCVPYVYPAGIKIDDIGLLCCLQNSCKQNLKIYKPKITESYVHSKKREESIVELDTSEISVLSTKKTSKLSSSKRQETKDLVQYHHRLAVERKDRLQYIMERYENDSRNDIDDEVDFNDFTLITKSGESKYFGCEDWNPDGYIFSKKNAQHMRKLVKSAQMNVKSTDIKKKMKCGKLPNLSKKNREQKSPEYVSIHELYKTSDINLSSKKVSSAKSTKKMHSSWQDVSHGSSDATSPFKKFDELTMNKNQNINIHKKRKYVSLHELYKTSDINLSSKKVSSAKSTKKMHSSWQDVFTWEF